MKKTLKLIWVLIALIIVGALIWGMIEPYTVGVTQLEVDLPNLPAGWQGKRVAVISDFQVGFWLDNINTIRRIVNRIQQDSPDLVLILGDFIYHGGENATDRIDQAVALVQPLRESGLPVVAVLGNHDYSVAGYNPKKIDYERASHLTSALEEIGVIVLENESHPLPEGLSIVGIGAYMIRNSDADAAFSNLMGDQARIVIMHNPTSFGDIPAGKAPLAFAGHTHGGQVSLPLTPRWSIITYFSEEDVHLDGWIANYGQQDNRLYVNRGIGMSLLPIRFSASPELTYVTLR